MKEIKGYRILQTRELKDIHSTGTELIHIGSGAHLCVIENPQDTNKVFSIGFATPPEDDSGIPHILEHSVLCGSDRYPIKDPFVELAQGSLNTYLNAMTFPDKTLYPVASQNEQDLRNLIDVYMDAVFHPAILKDDRIMMQEGWHYELNDPEEPIQIVGVVYNEMKGAYSSAESAMFRGISQCLFPGTPYEYESGGHPDAIPELTQEHFRAYYQKYYHPSNSYIFLYGDMEMESYLKWFDEAYLSGMEAVQGYDPRVMFPKAKKPEGIVRQEITYSIDEGSPENEGFLTYTFAVDDADPETVIALDIVEYLLLEMQSSPLRRALIDAGIGKDVDGSTDITGHHAAVSIIARGADISRSAEFEQIINQTLKKIASEGFDPKAKLAALNRTEFSVREADHGTHPAGLHLAMSNVYPLWTYGGDPFAWMEMGRLLSSIREKTLGEAVENGAKPGLLEELITSCMLECERKALVTMKPVVNLAAQEEQKLAQTLADYKASLTPEAIGKMVETTQELIRYQEEPDSPEALSRIPHLHVSDLKRKVRSVEVSEIAIGTNPDGSEQKLIWTESAANGILYLNGYYDLTGLSREELACASFLTSLMGSMDTDIRSYEEWSNEVQIHTGGIGMDCAVRVCRDQSFVPEMIISGKCLAGEEIAMQELIAESLLQTRYEDRRRFHELVNEEYEGLKAQIENSSVTVALNRAEAQMLPSAALDDVMNGLGYYGFIKELADHFEERCDAMLEKLRKTAQKIFCLNRLTQAGGTNAENKEALLAAARKTTERIPFSAGCKVEDAQQKMPEHRDEGLMFPGKVLYNITFGEFPQEYTGSMQVASHILSLGYLWGQVRVQGGAYGVFCGFSPINRTMYLASYRDPNLKQTYEVFEGTADYLKNFDCTEEEMEKYILGTVGSMDTPWTPAMQIRISIRMFRTGMMDLERRQMTRNQVLDTTPADIRKVGEAVEAVLQSAVHCSFGNRDAILEEKERFDEIYDVMTEVRQ